MVKRQRIYVIAKLDAAKTKAATSQMPKLTTNVRRAAFACLGRDSAIARTAAMTCATKTAVSPSWLVGLNPTDLITVGKAKATMKSFKPPA